MYIFFFFFHADRHINNKETNGKPFVVRYNNSEKNDQDRKREEPTFLKSTSLVFDKI